MRLYILATLLGLSTSVYAVSAVILEEVKGIPPGWSFQGNANVSDKITLFVALREPGIEHLKAKLNQRRSPGQHLTGDEVLEHRRPAATTARAVTDWLGSGGIRDIHNHGSLLSFEAPAGVVKSLLRADLGYYAYNGSDAKPVLRAPSYTIPASLREHIDFVHPLTNFMPPRLHHGHRRKPKPWPRPHPMPHPHPGPTKQQPPTSTQTPTTTLSPVSTSMPLPSPSHEDLFPNLPCLAATVPNCIKKLYNITTPSLDSTSPSPVRLGVAGFLEQWILHSDVDTFLDIFAPHLSDLRPPVNFTVELVNNGTNPQDSPSNAGLEASLDVQYALALGHPAHITYYSTGGRGTKLHSPTGDALPVTQSDNEPFFEFLHALLQKPDAELPHVLSISYADDELSVPRAYALRVCDMFAALAARGVSVLVATGDGGAAGTGQTRCVANYDTISHGNTTAGGGGGSGGRREKKMYVPTFPASCPYVTAVGATDNVAPPVAGAGFSAGGFSNFFGRPAWQEAVVRPYIERMVRENDTARLALFNHSGRATPDVSAIGSGFQIVMGGSNGQVLGTSASTPVVAAMVALVNDARMRAGKRSLGWLNPLLYSARVRAVLRDVTVGDSVGCWFPDGSISPGWSAGAGYDCVTGLGTVDDFNDFMAALL